MHSSFQFHSGKENKASTNWWRPSSERGMDRPCSIPHVMVKLV